MHKCGQCDLDHDIRRLFTSRPLLAKHVKDDPGRVDDVVWRCHRCPGFATYYLHNLDRHREAEHAGERGRRVAGGAHLCSECDRAFSKKDTLLR